MVLTMTNHGCYDISGADIATTVNAIVNAGGNLTSLSGAGLHFIPTANGQQVWLIEVNAT